MDYKKKYIKYKLKYSNLTRNRLRGGALEDVVMFEKNELMKPTFGVTIGENIFYIQDYFVIRAWYGNDETDDRSHIDMCCVTAGEPEKVNFFSCYSSKSDAGSWRLSMTSIKEKMEYYKGPNYVTGNLIHPELQKYIQLSIDTYSPRVQNLTWGWNRGHNGLYIADNYNRATRKDEVIYGGKWFFARTQPIDFFDGYYERFDTYNRERGTQLKKIPGLMEELASSIDEQIKYNYFNKYEQLMNSEYKSPVTYSDKFIEMGLPNVASLFNKIQVFSNSTGTICGNSVGIRPAHYDSRIPGREFKENMLFYINNNYKLDINQPVISEVISKFVEYGFEDPRNLVDRASIPMINPEDPIDDANNVRVNNISTSEIILKLLNECDEISDLMVTPEFIRNRDATMFAVNSINSAMDIVYLKYFIPKFNLPPITEIPEKKPAPQILFGLGPPPMRPRDSRNLHLPRNIDPSDDDDDFLTQELQSHTPAQKNYKILPVLSLHPKKTTTEPKTGGSLCMHEVTSMQVHDHRNAYKNRVVDFDKKWQNISNEFYNFGDHMIVILNKLHMETMRFIYATIQREINNVLRTDFTASEMVYSKTFDIDRVGFDVKLYTSPVYEKATNRKIMNFYHYALKKHDDTRENWVTMPHYYEIIGQNPTINGISPCYYEGGLYLCKPFEYKSQSGITRSTHRDYNFADTELGINSTYVYLGDLYSDLNAHMTKPQ